MDENNRQGAHEFEKNCIDVEELTEGVIGVFVNNKLRIAGEEIDFIHNSDVEINETILDEEARRDIEPKEANSATGASVLNGLMAGL